MSSPAELNKMLKGGSNTNSNSSRSISLQSTDFVRNSLSKILDDLNGEVCSLSSNENDSSNNNNEANSSQVQEVNKQLRTISHKTTVTANKIVLSIRYIASPLRLFVKAMANFKSEQERIQFVASIRICDRVKQDFVSNWNDVDTIGLKLLIKIYKFSTEILPQVLQSPELSMNMFSLTGKGPHFEPAYILYRIVSNNPIAHVTQWFNDLLKNLMEDPQFSDWVPDATQQLNYKIARELNIYASIAFAKPIQFKWNNGINEVQEKMSAEDLLRKIYDLFANSGDPSAMQLASQMNLWKNEQLGGKKHKKSRGKK